MSELASNPYLFMIWSWVSLWLLSRWQLVKVNSDNYEMSSGANMSKNLLNVVNK